MSDFAYDIAFSFLQRDEALALQLNDRLQDRLKTFIYTEQQKVVAGTDGEERFNRVFGKEARVVVVLYRKGWGESRWTRIEETAIRNRGHERGYNFVLFIPLDELPKVPDWLPARQVWIDLNRFGLDAAAAVIEARVLEAGGQVHQESVEDHARRVERQITFERRRAEFQREPGVQAVKQQLAELKRNIEAFAAKVNESTSIRLQVGEGNDGFWIFGLGSALGFNWRQHYFNTLEHAELEVRLFSHLPPGPNQWMMEKPTVVKSIKFAFDLLPSEVGGWILDDGSARAFSSEALADYVVKFYLEHGRSKK